MNIIRFRSLLIEVNILNLSKNYTLLISILRTEYSRTEATEESRKVSVNRHTEANFSEFS